MRPEILFPLFAPVTALPGVGPKFAAALEKLAGPRLVDLLWHLPTGVVDRRLVANIRAARSGAVVTLRVCVDAHQPASGPRRPYRVQCSDATAKLDLVFFHGRADYLVRMLPVGSTRLVSGLIDVFADTLQMTHPDYILAEAERDQLPAFEPIYPLSAGLSPRSLGKLTKAALARAPDLAEWLDPAWQAQRQWPSWRAALEQVHNPVTAAATAAETAARTRLAYDELLANQLALALIRARGRRRVGQSIRGDGRLAAIALDGLGFQLTGAQAHAVGEVMADMAAPQRMLRLLQGDVGSGKTVVALVAMLNAVESGCQAALMAPTEVLARQHLRNHTAARRGCRRRGRNPHRPRQGRRPPGAARTLGHGNPADRHRHPCAVPADRSSSRTWPWR